MDPHHFYSTSCSVAVLFLFLNCFDHFKGYQNKGGPAQWLLYSTGVHLKTHWPLTPLHLDPYKILGLANESEFNKNSAIFKMSDAISSLFIAMTFRCACPKIHMDYISISFAAKLGARTNSFMFSILYNGLDWVSIRF